MYWYYKPLLRLLGPVIVGRGGNVLIMREPHSWTVKKTTPRVGLIPLHVTQATQGGKMGNLSGRHDHIRNSPILEHFVLISLHSFGF